MKGPILIDTCVALWMMEDKLPPGAVEVLSRALHAGMPTYVSPITAWEIATMARKGRFRSQFSPQRWFEKVSQAPGMAIADLTAEVLMESQLLPGQIHDDPADRIIAATARELGFTVMTRGAALLAYAAEGYLAAIEC